MFKFYPVSNLNRNQPVSGITSSSRSLGFTLIELLVVISIIGVLSALLITNLVGARTRANDAKKKAELGSLVSSLRLYYNDYQNYPDGSGMINPGTGNLLPGALFEVNGTTYMKALPASYFYYSSAPNDSYILYAKLGNVSDDQLLKNFTKCCPAVGAPTGCPVTLTNQFILCE